MKRETAYSPRNHKKLWWWGLPHHPLRDGATQRYRSINTLIFCRTSPPGVVVVPDAVLRELNQALHQVRWLPARSTQPRTALLVHNGCTCTCVVLLKLESGPEESDEGRALVLVGYVALHPPIPHGDTCSDVIIPSAKCRIYCQGYCKVTSTLPGLTTL